MGPVPEPVASTGLSDEELPQHPPFVLSSSDEEDDNNEYFADGYIPITQQIQWLSDSEEEAESENSVGTGNGEADAAVADTGESVAPTAVEEEVEGELIDYSSVAGLMAALNTHGPTVIEGDHGLESAYIDDSDATSGATACSPAFESRIPENSGSVPNCSLTGPQLDAEKEEAIRSAMQGIILPPSAVPAWAANLQDDDLLALVKEKLDPK